MIQTKDEIRGASFDEENNQKMINKSDEQKSLLYSSDE